MSKQPVRYQSQLLFRKGYKTIFKTKPATNRGARSARSTRAGPKGY